MGTTDNHSLKAAADRADDEFYTRWENIQQGLAQVEKRLAGRVVYCPCDDWRISMFPRWLIKNFNRLRLRKIICRSYSPDTGLLPGFDTGTGRRARWMVVTRVSDSLDVSDTRFDMDALMRVPGNDCGFCTDDGDFRSPVSLDWWREADVAVTNPPFSLFRAFTDRCEHTDTDFMILGPLSAVGYRNMLPHLAAGSRHVIVEGAVHPKFDRPDGRTVNMGSIRWYTSLPYRAKLEWEPAMRYDPNVHHRYDGRPDMIDIPSMSLLPYDWDGWMGVPLTFMDRWNPDRWEAYDTVVRTVTVDGRRPFARILVRRRP